MKRSLQYMSCFAALLLMPCFAFAGSGWTPYVPVVELTATDQKSYLVKLKFKKKAGDCKNRNTFYQDYDASGSEQMFRVILEAVTSGKNIRVYVTGKCEINGYSEISSVSIAP